MINPAALSAIAQWAIDRGCGKYINARVIRKEPLTAADVAGFLADLDELEGVLAKTKNLDFRHTSHQLRSAYKVLGVPFLTMWELEELKVHEGLASGLYDSYDAVRAAYADLWQLAMHGGEIGMAKARPLLLRAAEELDAKGKDYAPAAAIDRWLATGTLDETEKARLVHRFESSKLELVAKPVKSGAKLDRQIGGFLKGEIDRAIVEKSFRQIFATCYHAGSPSDFSEKHVYIIAHNVFFEPGPPHATLALAKSCLAMFKPAHVKRRCVHVLDVPPIVETLAALRAEALALV
jgi:hypothetical protein